MDGSLFADDLPIYIITKNLIVAARALQGVTNRLDAWVAERSLTISSNKTVSMVFRKRNEKPLEIMLRNEMYPIFRNDTRQQIKLRDYYQKG